MINIYDYTNYRTYLKDYYDFKKAESGFTYRDFARLAGMNSTSWLLLLIKGAKNLSAESILRVCKALNLGKAETEYFKMMVPFTQAKTNAVKDHYFQSMLAHKRRLKISRVEEEQYAYYTKWYHPVVRSLSAKMDFRNAQDGQGGHDWNKLARSLIPPITARQAKQSVELLVKLGMITVDPEGRYSLASAVVSTGDEVASLNVVNYHKQVSRLAEDAHDLSVKEERDISALTLGISETAFQNIKTRIQTFRKEIMELAQNAVDADRVYQFNFQFFPVGKADRT